MDMEEILELGKMLWPVIVSGVVALIAGIVFYLIFKKFQRKTRWISNNDLYSIRKPAILLLVVTAVYVSAKIQFDDMFRETEQTFQVIFILTIAWMLIRFIRIGRVLLLRQYDISDEDNVEARKANTQILVFERIAIVVTIILAISFLLMTFDSIRQIGTSLLASAGIAGIIIGVAAQKLLANLLAGFQIAITQPIRINDVVIMEGEWGKIKEITLTYVVVAIWDERNLIVPSSQVIDKPFQNWTRNNSQILGTVKIYADYKLPVGKVRKQLDKILADSPLWDGRIHNLLVTNLTENTMELRALMSSRDASSGWDLRVYVREKLIEWMQNNYPDCLPRTRIEMVDSKK